MSTSEESTTPMTEIIEMMKKMMDEKVQKFSTHDDLKNSKTSIEAKLEKFATAVFDIVKENRALKEQIRILQERKNEDAKVLSRLDNHMRRKNLVVRGVNKNSNLEQAVDNLVAQKLKMRGPLSYQAVRKLRETDEKMDMIIELKTENTKHEVYAHVHNLRGHRILVEDDLNGERLQNKKVLLELKKEILSINDGHLVVVRSDRIKVGGRFLKYNKDRELMCGTQTAREYLETVYGGDVFFFNMDYDTLLSQVMAEQKL